jgi:AraC-like DNA-binding protein
MNIDNAKMWSVPHLRHLKLFRANIVKYAFKRHAHDYFVIGMIEEGVQKFDYRSAQYITPPHGIIVLNPAEGHTGEAAVPTGFRYRAMYPEADLLQDIASEVGERQRDIPFFPSPVIDDEELFKQIHRLHTILEEDRSALEQESSMLWTLAQLITRHADARITPRTLKQERQEVTRLKHYMEERYAENIKLADLAALVNWSPYYLLRVFHQAVGLPPHAYLESVRVRQAQHLLSQGNSLVDVAYATGFSSQSHFSNSFKQFIGVTPGQYAKEIKHNKESE